MSARRLGVTTALVLGVGAALVVPTAATAATATGVPTPTAPSTVAAASAHAGALHVDAVRATRTGYTVLVSGGTPYASASIRTALPHSPVHEEWLDADGSGVFSIRASTAFSFGVVIEDETGARLETVVGSGRRGDQGLAAVVEHRDWSGPVVRVAGADGFAVVTDEHGRELGADVVGALGLDTVQLPSSVRAGDVVHVAVDGETVSLRV